MFNNYWNSVTATVRLNNSTPQTWYTPTGKVQISLHVLSPLFTLTCMDTPMLFCHFAKKDKSSDFLLFPWAMKSFPRGVLEEQILYCKN